MTEHVQHEGYKMTVYQMTQHVRVKGSACRLSRGLDV